MKHCQILQNAVLRYRRSNCVLTPPYKKLSCVEECWGGSGECEELGAVGGFGEDDFREAYVKASYSICEERDVKGLYAKARAGEIPDFTGKASTFEEPDSPWLTIDTENSSAEESLVELTDAVLTLVRQVA